MTQDNTENTVNTYTNITSKKPSTFLLKSFIILTIFVIVFLFYRNLNNHNITPNKIIDLTFNKDKDDETILDIAEDLKNSQETTIYDLTVSEIKEKGVEFIYQLLIKNQTQIDEINKQLITIKDELIKQKNHEKLNRLIFSYIEFREKLFLGLDYKINAENFDLLSISDSFLHKKFSIIKLNAAQYVTHDKIVSEFNDLSTQLIINKGTHPAEKSTFFDKITNHLKTLIIVRKIKNFKEGEIDGEIHIINQALLEKRYNDALNKILSLDKKYFTLVEKFLQKLNVVIEIDNADKEIITYLKSLN